MFNDLYPLERRDGRGRRDHDAEPAEYLLRVAQEDRLTLRQLAYRAAAPRSDFTGTPEQIADRLQLYFETQACDGFMMATDISPRGLSAIVDQVVPILQKRGLFRTEYEGSTLRSHLDLPVPKTRYV